MSWILLIIMTLFGALGGLFFKQATDKLNKFEKIKYLIIGVGFYGIGALLNIIVLRLLPYTIVYPLTAVTYIWTLLLSFFILKEHINTLKILGVICILAGVIIIVQ